MTTLKYLGGYPPQLITQAQSLLEAGKLGEVIAERYPQDHSIRSNKELFRYVQELKAKHMRTSAPLAKVLYDDKLKVIRGALGLHTTTTKQHGSKMQKRRELRVASLFKDAPAPFLRMIVVHELAHMKHSDHDREFYKLCVYMEPEYHQLELDVRLYLTAQDWQE
jgi:predicted metal-dependent hydrolase